MPNTHVLAAGEAMPAAEGMQIITGRFSRRAMLVGAVASLPAMAGAAAAPAVSTIVDMHPDAELLRLDAEMEALHARSDEIGREASRLQEMAWEAAGPRPLNPIEWAEPSAPDDIRQMRRAWLRTCISDALDDEAIKKDAARCPEPVKAWQRACAEEKARVQAAWDAYDKECARQGRLLGLQEKEDEDQEWMAADWDLGQRIFATSASTLAGMAVKLRASDRLGLENFPENEAFMSIAADIRRLMEGGAA